MYISFRSFRFQLFNCLCCSMMSHDEDHADEIVRNYSFVFLVYLGDTNRAMNRCLRGLQREADRDTDGSIIIYIFRYYDICTTACSPVQYSGLLT